MNDAMKTAISTLTLEGAELAREHQAHDVAKRAKMNAEDAVFDTILNVVRPNLAALVSLDRKTGLRVLPITEEIKLTGEGYFITAAGKRISLVEVACEIPPSVLLAVLLAAVRAQRGQLAPRTAEVRREANILEGIAQAFRAGGVK